MSPDAPTPDDQATTDVPLLAGRYQLLEQLGQGGMGAVFRARDAQLERPVALKMLPQGSAPDAGAVARFRREAKALAKLSHPGIIQAYDSGEDGGKHFLVMELVEGQSLAALLREQARVSPARAADFAYQAALALHHAHQRGLVHRDVKPSNLLLSSDGRVRLLDLGLARFLQDQIGEAHLTRTGTGMGTPDYCPPEQFRDARQADARSDVYALGCTLYHLIAGRVPFPGSSLSEKVEAHETKEPAPLEELCPDVPAGLALAVRRMMTKRPADRFRTMAEVAEALTPYVAGSSALFPSISKSATWDGSRLATMTALPRRRRLVALSLAGTAAAVLLLAGVVGLVGSAAGWFRPGAGPVAQLQDTQPEGTPKTETLGDRPQATADDPNVLTVSQEEKDGGKYQTIAAALEAVKPGQTIRVLDGATYAEALALRSPTAQDNIILEAVRGATIEVPAQGGVGIELQGVASVTVRGFRLRGSGGLTALVLAECVGAGVVLEDLDLELPVRQLRAEDVLLGITVESHRVDAGSPLVVRRCRFRGGRSGVQVLDRGGDSAGVAVRENDFTDVLRGVLVQGSWRRLAVVGNRIRRSLIGIQLETLGGNTTDMLLANNTFFDDQYAIRLVDSGVRGGIACRNNLILNRGISDVVYYSWDGRSEAPSRPGDVAALGKAWQMTHNWREVAEPHGDSLDDKSWVPPGPTDVRKDKIDGVSRDPKSPDFLRPGKDSPLATRGAGNEDPSLPRYVGALPPEGTEPWDWDRAWRMPKDAQLLTVSKEPSGGGKYRTINDALTDAKPWATVRVLGTATYEEVISLTDRKRYEGLTLEAVGGATLHMASGVRGLIAVEDVPHVRVDGFRCTEGGSMAPGAASRTFVVVSGMAQGIALTRLVLTPKTPMIGVVLQNALAPPGEPPLRVEQCAIRPECPTSNDGISVVGTLEPDATGGICIRSNRIVNCAHGINVRGALRDVHVTGNLLVKCPLTGLQVEDVAPGSRGLLFANNTAFASSASFRLWDNTPYKEPQPGQVEIANNIFFAATDFDVAFVLNDVKNQQQSPGDGKELLKVWHFHHNRRDLSGSGAPFMTPISPDDGRFKRDEVLSIAASELDRVRPARDSPLATQGAGMKDGSLPLYIGALPREGDLAWAWDRTWRARAKKTEDKK